MTKDYNQIEGIVETFFMKLLQPLLEAIPILLHILVTETSCYFLVIRIFLHILVNESSSYFKWISNKIGMASSNS